MTATRITFLSGDRELPPTVIDAIGGEPAAVFGGDAHVKVYTWSGALPPYTTDNAQVLYLTVDSARSLGVVLTDAAAHVARNLDDEEIG